MVPGILMQMAVSQTAKTVNYKPSLVMLTSVVRRLIFQLTTLSRLLLKAMLLTAVKLKTLLGKQQLTIKPLMLLVVPMLTQSVTKTMVTMIMVFKRMMLSVATPLMLKQA